MIVTLTNVEIEHYLNIIANPASFRNNIEVKIPANLDWTLRLNLKKLNEIYGIFVEARNDIQKEFVDAGKADMKLGKIKDEFIGEYNQRYIPLAIQKNELELRPIKYSDFKDIDALSSPERDFLFLMVDGDPEKEIKEEK